MTKEHLMIVDGRKELVMTILKFGAGVIIGVIITALSIDSAPNTFSRIMRDIKSLPHPVMKVPQPPEIGRGSGSGSGRVYIKS